MNIVNLKSDPSHIPTLARWHHEEWGYLNPEGSVEKRIKKIEKHLSEDLIPSTFLAKQDTMLLGSAAIVESDMDSHRELAPWLAGVFVAPEHRGKGVGSALVNYVVEHARRSHFKTLYLFTPSKEHFYSRLGWSFKVKEEYLGISVTIMAIELNCEPR